MKFKLALANLVSRKEFSVIWVTLTWWCVGCTSSISTQYIPKDPNMMRISVSHGQTGLAKNNAFAGFGATTPVRRGYQMAAITACDSAVEERARQSKGDFTKSATLMNVATAMTAIGLAPGVIGLTVLTPLSAQKYHDAMAGAVDAMNMHNDAETCIHPVEPPAAEGAVGADGQPQVKTDGYTNMAELKAARLAGKLPDAEYREWQQKIRAARQDELEALERDYDNDKLSRSEYKAKQAEIVHKYEGR